MNFFSKGFSILDNGNRDFIPNMESVCDDISEFTEIRFNRVFPTKSNAKQYKKKISKKGIKFYQNLKNIRTFESILL
jgi:hypothetical protein